MMIAESVARLAATLLAVARTRVELAATEVEEQTLRYFSWLMLSLAAMFCVGIAAVLGIFLAVLLYWETHRVSILLALMLLFGGAGIGIGMHIRRQYLSKPKLLGDTMHELTRDAELLQPPAS